MLAGQAKVADFPRLSVLRRLFSLPFAHSQITQRWEMPNERPEIASSQGASTMPDADGSECLFSSHSLVWLTPLYRQRVWTVVQGASGGLREEVRGHDYRKGAWLPPRLGLRRNAQGLTFPGHLVSSPRRSSSSSPLLHTQKHEIAMGQTLLEGQGKEQAIADAEFVKQQTKS